MDAAGQMLASAAAYSEVARAICDRLLMSARNVNVRAYAALGLARAGYHSPEVWHYLLIQRHDSSVAESIRSALRDSPNAIAALKTQPQSTNSIERYVAASLLGAFDYEVALVTRVLSELVTTDGSTLKPALRREAMALLCVLGRFDAVVALLSAAPDERFLVADIVMDLVGFDNAISVLLEPLLNSADPKIRFKAARIESWPNDDDDGMCADRIEEIMSAFFAGGELGQRVEAAKLLLRSGHISNAAVSVVLEATKASLSPKILSGTIDALEVMSERPLRAGRVSHDVVPTLIDLLSCGHPRLRLATAEILRQMNRETERIVKVAQMELKRRKSPLRGRAGWLLYQLGRGGEQAIACIMEFGSLHQIDSIIQGDAIASARLATLAMAQVESKDFSVRSRAIYVLHALGKGDERVVAAAESLLKSHRLNERVHAARILKDMGKCGEGLVVSVMNMIDCDGSEEYDYGFGAHRVLLGLLQSAATLRIVARVVLAAPIGAVVTYQRVIGGGGMTADDARSIHGLVRAEAKDRKCQKLVRDWLFVQLWRARGGVEHVAMLDEIPF